VKRSTRHALVAFLAAGLACCTTWGRSAPLSRSLLDSHPRLVRVTLADGRRFDVQHPSARGDTLVGDSAGPWRRDVELRYPVAIPFSDVRSVSRRQFSAGRTVVLVAGVTAAAAAVVVVVAVLSYDGMDFSNIGSGESCDGYSI